MRFYVKCRIHPNERIYIRFEREPQTKNEIPFWTFQMTCPQGHPDTYYRNEVIAEMGLEPIGGAILGGLLFLVDPLAGVIGASAGLFGMAAHEEEKVRRFNESV